jgi:hypothetical protein
MPCQGCGKPTRPFGGGRRAHQVAPDGSRWRLFCSRSCASRVAGRNNPTGAAAVRAYWTNYRARVLDGILTALAPHTRTIDGRTYAEVQPLVRFILRERRTAYTRGATAQYQRQRRQAAA